MMKKQLTSLLSGVLTLTMAFSLSTTALAVSQQNEGASSGIAEKQVQREQISDRQWQREKQIAAVSYYGPEEAGHPQYDQPSAFRPTWLPEGWSLESADKWDLVDQICLWYFRNGASRLEMKCYRRSAGYIGAALYDHNAPVASRQTVSEVKLQQVQVQGRSADFYQAGSTGYLFWENNGGDLFVLEGDLDQTEMVQVADSVKEVKNQTLPEYKLSWVPEDSGKMSQSVTMLGYVQQANNEGNCPLRFVYANQALAAPEGMPETVTVQGAQGQLWLGDQDAKGITVTSSITGKTFELPTEETWSTLIWTDPETGICFYIQGNKLTKETMLRMAESVTLTETTSESVQSAANNKASGSTVAASGSKDPNTSRQSWVADGMQATITHADGTVERVPNFSELFPGQKLSAN